MRPMLTACISTILFLSTTILSAAPANHVTNIFKPLSTPAKIVSETSMLVLWISLGIFLTVGGLLLYIVIRFRQRKGDVDREPPQIYGSNQIELAWTVMPILIVFVLILVTARTIADVQNAKQPPGAINVTVVGHQWWWEIRYPQFGIVTANELHVPVSDPTNRRPTFLKLESADVAHSFWVPQLAGKTDLLPNRDNRMWIEPLQTGTFVGNCAEYCGTQHAWMLLRVIVHDPASFEQWVNEQKSPPVNDPNVAEGRHIFLSTSCVNCHAVQNSSAGGVFGPDLTHLMSRETIGAGVAPNNAMALKDWIRDPQSVKEGCLMPNMQLSDQEQEKMVSYLLTLK